MPRIDSRHHHPNAWVIEMNLILNANIFDRIPAILSAHFDDIAAWEAATVAVEMGLAHAAVVPSVEWCQRHCGRLDRRRFDYLRALQRMELSDVRAILATCQAIATRGVPGPALPVVAADPADRPTQGARAVTVDARTGIGSPPTEHRTTVIGKREPVPIETEVRGGTPHQGVVQGATGLGH